jgi:CRISPR-associated protein Cmr3
MTTFLRISGRDPLVARDGRPFGAGQGNRMRSAGWLHPSVVAGSFRTTLAKEAPRDFDATTQDELLCIEVAGVLPLAGGQLYLPAPNDCVIGAEVGVCRARPELAEPAQGAGADWPAGGLRPVVLDTERDFKPEPVPPAFWPMNRFARWLAGEKIDPRAPDFLNRPMEDLRDHVSLEPETGAAEEGLLFTTAGIGSLALQRHGSRLGEAKPTGPPRFDSFAEIELAARVGPVPLWGQQVLQALSTWHPLGGERRLAHWSRHDDAKLWECHKDVKTALGRANQERVTMTLATPAIFRDGWKPGWLDAQLTGEPFAGGPRLRLVGVCIQRWRAVSGWSYKAGGPKAIRRMVPAGGVYFFDLIDKGRAAELATQWLGPVSDDPQDRRDGFGLAVWGIW